MHRFYFNECLPKSCDVLVFVSHFVNTIKEFDKLLKNEIGVERGIVTHKLPSDILFEGYSLLNVIESIPENEIRTLAFSLFGRHYPIDAYFDETHEDLLENLDNYRVTIDGNAIDALNLAIVQLNDAFVFSPALHGDLAKHPLVIQNVLVDINHEVNNLYGDETNTAIIKDEIVERNNACLGTYEKLITLFGKQKVSKQFPRDFDSLTNADQRNVIKHFQEAKDRNGPTPFFADGGLVKDVTPEKAKNNIYELRIFKPRALRVYFSEKDGYVYLASIGYKTSGDQDNDIRSARAVIDKLMLVAK